MRQLPKFNTENEDLGNVCFIRIRSKLNSVLLMCLLRIFMKQTFSHIHVIVCAKVLKPIFKYPKSCQTAAQNLKFTFQFTFHDFTKVIYTKYSKHWPYTVAHTIDYVCSEINNSWFNPLFPFYFSSLYPAPYTK